MGCGGGAARRPGEDRLQGSAGCEEEGAAAEMLLRISGCAEVHSEPMLHGAAAALGSARCSFACGCPLAAQQPRQPHAASSPTNPHACSPRHPLTSRSTPSSWW